VLVAFVGGGLYTLALVLLTRKAAKKRWDENFMSRYKEEARSEIAERDAYIAELKAQLKDAQETIRQLADARKAAITMSARLSEVLVIAQPIRTYRHG
jgi:hypothetical protein